MANTFLEGSAGVCRSTLAIATLMPLIGCADLTQPPEEGTTTPPVRFGAALTSMMSDATACPGVDACALIPVEGGQACVCELDGIAVNVPGGSGYPGSYPSWPDAPGFPHPDPGQWPVSPGGGSWPSLPQPGPGECDPHGITNSCFFSAQLSCPTEVPRGTFGTCTLTLDPSTALDTVYVWTFNGAPIHATNGQNTTTWSGTLVQSGQVRVEFRALGRNEIAASTIKVNPRNWSWASSKSFSQGSPGDLDNCITSQAGLTADKFGCSAGNPGVLINPGPNQGFTISQGSGPNAGAWYVTSPATRMDLRTQLAKKYRPDETTTAVNGVAPVVQACGAAYSPNPVPPQNNHGVNTTCFQTADFSALVSFTWNHEGQHLTLAQQEAGKPYNDIYARWDSIVRPSQALAFNAANIIQNGMHVAVADTANKIHTGGSTVFDFWYHIGSGSWQWAAVTVFH